MTYLAALRVHFAGSFQANPSTVNNEASHFDDARFQPRFQEPFSGGNDPSNWNPRGDGSWRLIGCRVTSAWHGDGSPAAAGDPLLAARVADADDRVAAKIADLDPQQQMASMIFGLEVRIADAAGATLVGGRFEPAAFCDIFPRAPGGGLAVFSAAYQSVLHDLRWGDVSASPLLSELRAAAGDGLLSIRFVLDGMDADPTSSTFTLGRVVGTIGAASAAEPRHFVAGRALAPRTVRPRRPGFAAAVVDAEHGKVHCDLGNALPTARPGGGLVSIGALELVCLPPGKPPLAIGPIDARPGMDWYRATAGVVSLPADRALTTQELATIAQAPLAIVADGRTVALAEAPDGVHVRADQFVYRLDAGETAPVTVYATRFGAPLAGLQVVAQPEAAQLGPTPPPVAEPAGAIALPAPVATDPRGIAELPIATSDPGTPRGYLDGQVYGVRPLPAGASGPPFNPTEYVSLLVWSAFAGGEPLTWWDDVEPILRQYANLYPVMGTFVDLGDYDAVCANRELLLLAFGLDPSDPNSMPVTRDLSGAKRAALLRWLRDVGRDGKPLEGTPPAPRVAAPQHAAAATDGDGAGGGKEGAMERLEAARRAAEEPAP